MSETSQMLTDFLGAPAFYPADAVVVRRRWLESRAKDEEIGGEGEGDNLDVAPVGGMNREGNASASDLDRRDFVDGRDVVRVVLFGVIDAGESGGPTSGNQVVIGLEDGGCDGEESPAQDRWAVARHEGIHVAECQGMTAYANPQISWVSIAVDGKLDAGEIGDLTVD